MYFLARFVQQQQWNQGIYFLLDLFKSYWLTSIDPTDRIVTEFLKIMVN